MEPLFLYIFSLILPAALLTSSRAGIYAAACIQFGWDVSRNEEARCVADYSMVFTSWVTVSLLISYRFPSHFHFLFTPCDDILQTGNNMSLFSPSVIYLFAICQSYVLLFWFISLFILYTPNYRSQWSPSAGFIFSNCHGCFAPSSSLLSNFIRSCLCSFELWHFKAKSGALQMCGEDVLMFEGTL